MFLNKLGIFQIKVVNLQSKRKQKRMESIKEKAEESCIKYGNLGNVAYQEFVVGANYVLDEIEEFLPKDSSPVIKKSLIKALIEQLKSNQ